MTDDDERTCYFLPERCPQCCGRMCSNGYLDWCERCSYLRDAERAPLDSWGDDPLAMDVRKVTR